MPGGATLNSFSQTIIDQSRFGIESQVYTYGPVTLGTGSTTIFSVQNWNRPTDQIQKVCILEAIAAGPSDANVQIYWKTESQQSDTSQGWIDGYPYGYRFLDTFAVAGTQLALYVNNQRTTTLANFQLNYKVTVMTFNLFQRLLWGLAATPADTAAVQTLQDQENTRAAQQAQASGKNVQPKNISTEIAQMLASGSRPFSTSAMMDALFANRRKDNPAKAVPFHQAIAATATVSTGTVIPVPSGYVSVLRGVFLRSSDTGMNLMIDRDNDLAIVNQLNAAAFVQGDYLPFDFFMPALDHYNAYVNGTGGTTYPVRLDIRQYQQSDLLMGHLWVPGYIKPKIQTGLQ